VDEVSGLLRRLLPTDVAVREAWSDDVPTLLWPEEAAHVHRAVERRRLEFGTARRCAREAMADLGHRPGPVLVGASREPVWPPGLVGSITHTDGYRAAAVASSGDVASLGIDAEPNEPLPADVLPSITSASERTRLQRRVTQDGRICWDRLLFSAKEAVYKAWFGLAGRWLDFSEVDVDLSAEHFTATLLVSGPLAGQGPGVKFQGLSTVGRGLVVTAVLLRPDEQASIDQPWTGCTSASRDR
jgi:4'-phosphopantetheinyl transferase EntD